MSNTETKTNELAELAEQRITVLLKWASMMENSGQVYTVIGLLSDLAAALRALLAENAEQRELLKSRPCADGNAEPCQIRHEAEQFDRKCKEAGL